MEAIYICKQLYALSLYAIFMNITKLIEHSISKQMLTYSKACKIKSHLGIWSKAQRQIILIAHDIHMNIYLSI